MTPSATLFSIADDFRAAATGGPDALVRTAVGLRGLLAVAGGLRTRSADLHTATDAVATAISQAAPVIRAVAPDVAPERLYFVLGATAGLANYLGGSGAWANAHDAYAASEDAVDHIALLADELDALHRRRRIAARGDLLGRHIAISDAAAAVADGAPLH
jgi:hypothetical protein